MYVSVYLDPAHKARRTAKSNKETQFLVTSLWRIVVVVCLAGIHMSTHIGWIVKIHGKLQFGGRRNAETPECKNVGYLTFRRNLS